MGTIIMLTAGPKTETGPGRQVELKHAMGLPGGSETVLSATMGGKVRSALDRCGRRELSRARAGLLALGDHAEDDSKRQVALIARILSGKRN